MVTDSMTKKDPKVKVHSALVFPANNPIGLDMCKDLVHGEKKERCEKVIAVCTQASDEWVEQLKMLGATCQVVILVNPVHMDSWKEALKDEKADAMLLVTVPTTAQHKDSNGHPHPETPNGVAQSFERAVELAPELGVKCLLVLTAFCADDSKYKIFHEIYSAIDSCAQKHFRGKMAVLFHQLVFETLLLNHEEIRRESKLSWPVSATSQCCPLALDDVISCVSEAMYQSIGKKDAGKKDAPPEVPKRFYLTGSDSMTPQNMIDAMSKSYKNSIVYNKVEIHQWKHSLQGKLSPLAISLIMELFEMMEDSKLMRYSDDAEMLLGQKPGSFDKWLGKHQDDFCGPRKQT
jgi:hypothetical protein